MEKDAAGCRALNRNYYCRRVIYMRALFQKRMAGSLNSSLIRRPIQRWVWLFLLPTFEIGRAHV